MEATRASGKAAAATSAAATMRSPVNWALLGLVIERPSYGYELRSASSGLRGRAADQRRVAYLHGAPRPERTVADRGVPAPGLRVGPSRSPTTAPPRVDARLPRVADRAAPRGCIGAASCSRASSRSSTGTAGGARGARSLRGGLPAEAARTPIPPAGDLGRGARGLSRGWPPRKPPGRGARLSWLRYAAVSLRSR